MVRKGLDAVTARDVKQMELDLRKPTFGLQCLCLLELRILLQVFDGSLSPALIASRQVNQERPIVERRLGVLKGELLDYGASNTL
jgi:hypothetical protein